MTFDLRKLFGNIADKKVIYISGIIGVLLLFVSTFATHDEPEMEMVEETKDYCTETEDKMEFILSKIEGVGKVNVMITLKNNGNITLAKDKDVNIEKTIVLSKKGGGEETQTVSEAYPEIQGVVIVADGGGNMKTKENLTLAAKALLNTDAHKIIVFERTVDK